MEFGTGIYFAFIFDCLKWLSVSSQLKRKTSIRLSENFTKWNVKLLWTTLINTNQKRYLQVEAVNVSTMQFKTCKKLAKNLNHYKFWKRSLIELLFLCFDLYFERLDGFERLLIIVLKALTSVNCSAFAFANLLML